MSARIKKHLWYYVSLAGILTLGFLLIIFTSHSKPLQMTAVIMTTVLYVFWTLLHHYIHHSLPVKIVVEYILIAILGVSLSLFLFNI